MISGLSAYATAQIQTAYTNGGITAVAQLIPTLLRQVMLLRDMRFNDTVSHPSDLSVVGRYNSQGTFQSFAGGHYASGTQGATGQMHAGDWRIAIHGDTVICTYDGYSWLGVGDEGNPNNVAMCDVQGIAIIDDICYLDITIPPTCHVVAYWSSRNHAVSVPVGHTVHTGTLSISVTFDQASISRIDVEGERVCEVVSPFNGGTSVYPVMVRSGVTSAAMVATLSPGDLFLMSSATYGNGELDTDPAYSDAVVYKDRGLPGASRNAIGIVVQRSKQFAQAQPPYHVYAFRTPRPDEVIYDTQTSRLLRYDANTRNYVQHVPNAQYNLDDMQIFKSFDPAHVYTFVATMLSGVMRQVVERAKGFASLKDASVCPRELVPAAAEDVLANVLAYDNQATIRRKLRYGAAPSRQRMTDAGINASCAAIGYTAETLSTRRAMMWPCIDIQWRTTTELANTTSAPSRIGIHVDPALVQLDDLSRVANAATMTPHVYRRGFVYFYEGDTGLTVQPREGDTVTIHGVVFRFYVDGPLLGAINVHIGATPADTMQALYNAVVTHVVNAGYAYVHLGIASWGWYRNCTNPNNGGADPADVSGATPAITPATLWMRPNSAVQHPVHYGDLAQPGICLNTEDGYIVPATAPFATRLREAIAPVLFDNANPMLVTKVHPALYATAPDAVVGDDILHVGAPAPLNIPEENKQYELTIRRTDTNAVVWHSTE